MDTPITRIVPPPLERDTRNLEDTAPSLEERSRQVKVRRDVEDLLAEQQRKRREEGDLTW